MKLKDYFTLGNLLSGFAAVVSLFLGHFDLSCYLIFFGYACDVLDGPVARWTKQFDAFGGFLDEVSDYITNSIAVSFIIFYAFWKNAHYPWWVAAILGAFPFTFGTIRQAKSMETKLSYPCYWLGVPRPVAALFMLAMLNSSLFSMGVSPWKELGQALAAGFVVILSILHLSQIPFVNHHHRRWMWALKFGFRFFIITTPLSFFIGLLFLSWPGLIYDCLFANMMVYLFVSWTSIPREDRKRIKEYIQGKPLVLPLVHQESAWRSRSVADYYLAHLPEYANRLPPQSSSAFPKEPQHREA
jgi:CDP-diacylglycerol---serine O-phosphatidyltransferase